MLNWNELMVKQKHTDLLREAERQRLVRAALAGRRQHARFYAPMLARLGVWLVAWGWRLRARYGSIELAVETGQGHDRTAFL